MATTKLQSAPEKGGGILPDQAIAELVRKDAIKSETGNIKPQIQPASLDLQLGRTAYRVRASFLPGRDKTVRERIEELSMHEIDLSNGAVLEVGCVYIVPLQEKLDLPEGISGLANPKSSTGRLNVFTRLIADNTEQFDQVPDGYSGPLYAEIAPNAFSVLVRPGVRLNQLRLRHGQPDMDDGDLQRLHEEAGIVGENGAQPGTAEIRKGLVFTVDLKGNAGSQLIGYRAKRHTSVVDLSRIGAYDPREFWDPLHVSARNQLILDPNEFYILASRESVRIPPDYAAEMVPYDTQIGEFRVHYAGFFDPGFGWQKERSGGTRAVLEVRSHEVPFVLEDGQAVGRLVYEKLAERPETLYGASIGSSYHAQALTLSKHFQPWSA
ncbi:2'-deoxycytidine 5'-triphosphate deaminase [Fodinicurvata sediminis]|uniref:2'-deoxycytidine 5'-triphosphate deaminase n=1 Tax=Fodinicurvata sediminis TaxID=1121832 RepID=UPI0003B4F634|nr:2'-deoxycytidine 5'-triphosphate deaminase [Fodinicurvata sediminis]